MKISSKRGFTLIELLVAMAVASIVMAAIVSAYQIQVRGKNTQDAVMYMTQNARAGLEVMAHDIRMAGCDPDDSADARIITANAGQLVFTRDINNGAGDNISDGDCCDANEAIQYQLTNDAGGDGVNDSISSGVECHLGRETGPGLDPGCGGATGGLQPLARNVDALNFVYLDEDGNVTATPGDIRTIEVTIVARSGDDEGGLLFSHTDNTAYQNQRGQVILPAQNDGFRRFRLTATVHCRNL